MSHDDDNSAPSLYSNSSNDDSTNDDGGTNRSNNDFADAADPGEQEDGVDPEEAEKHLNDLFADRKLRELMQSGDYEGFRNRLRERQSRANDDAKLAAIEYALGHPDEFAEPIQSAPTLWTLNGIGTKVYGTNQQDSTTGFYLTTLYFTILWIPIIPISRYLVRSYGEEYQFFAKVDVSSFHSWWRRLALFAVLAVAGGIAWAIATQKPDVRFVNGLDKPVAITVDGKQTIDVPSRSVEVEQLTAGKHKFVTRYDVPGSGNEQSGSLIEKTTYELPQYTDLIAYNVAGIAPAYVRDVIYFSETSAARSGDKPSAPEIKPIAGQTWYVNDDIDYFNAVEPPESIEMTAGSDKEVRWRFRYDGGGAAESASMLKRHAPDQLGSFLKQAVKLHPTDEWFFYYVEQHLSKMAKSSPDKVGEWLDLLQNLALEHPAAMSLHSFYISQYERFGDETDHPNPVEAYRNRHNEQNSASSALMLAHVVKSRSEAKNLLEKVLKKAASDSEFTYEAHRQLGTLHADMDDCEAAMPHFDKGQPSGTRLSDSYLQSYAECAAFAGDTDKALELLKTHTDYSSPSAIQLATTYGQIALTAGGDADPMLMLNTVGEHMKGFSLTDDDRVLFATRMGLVLSENELKTMKLEKEGEAYAKLHRAATTNPDQLVAAFAQHPKELTRINFEIELLTSLLAQVQADEQTRKQLESSLMTSSFLKPAKLAEETNDFAFDAPPPADWKRGEKAAYYIAKSRVVSGNAAQKQALNKAKEQLRLHRPMKVAADAYLAKLK